VTPRPRKQLDDDSLERLRRAAAGLRAAKAEQRDAVVAAAEAGGSVRVIAEAGEVSTRTVQDWLAHRAD
jgi:dihydrodipicolinate synthase/N-acetylneuraminate lyase